MPSASLAMRKYRAIMMSTDRERLTGKADIHEEKRYQTVHRVWSRIKELETDVEVLEEHHPELLKELRDMVCEDW